MLDCEDFAELISAYIDDELSESDRHIVEDHIATCPACFDSLYMYRSISAAMNESMMSAPDALSASVMASVAKTKTAQKDKAVKVSSTIHLIQSRIIPAVTCLALIALLIPALISLSRSSSSGKQDGESSFKENGAMSAYGQGIPSTAASDAGAGGFAADAGSSAESSPSSAGAGGAGTAPSEADYFSEMDEKRDIANAEEQPAAAPMAEASDGSASANADANANANAGANANTSASASVGTSLSTDNNANSGDAAVSMETKEKEAPPEPDDNLRDAPAAAPAPSSVPAETQEAVIDNGGNRAEPPTNAAIPNNASDASDADASYEGSQLDGGYSSYYAVIFISGELPSVLTGYDKVAVDDVISRMKIPREAADSLIASGIGGVTFEYANSSAEEAIVIFEERSP